MPRFSWLWITDPGTKEKSVSLSLLIYTFIIASSKLYISGSTFHITYGAKSIEKAFGAFSGGDWALVVGTAAALYWQRKKDKRGEGATYGQKDDVETSDKDGGN